ncbi:uncharacterized protein LOC100192740 isoform 2 [Zea mays]|uniref:Uncharacterized protein n=1 Tax=Zea mays TaxID=4577 RepID=C0P666_MAIZE|nr:uncharacterized protein LOC100192740 isoform 2 [Zea mays]ACN28482.1 unknown [Zea mays]|eukprot:NP_001168512.1 uncharacterized protein LOC100192740 isoform 2 [Zea mays]
MRAAARRLQPSYGTSIGSSATAAASPTSAVSSSHLWRTARSRSSGWPRRGSSRRARPAKSSGRSLTRLVCRWVPSRFVTRRSHGPPRRLEWSPVCSASPLKLLVAKLAHRRTFAGGAGTS